MARDYVKMALWDYRSGNRTLVKRPLSPESNCFERVVTTQPDILLVISSYNRQSEPQNWTRCRCILRKSIKGSALWSSPFHRSNSVHRTESSQKRLYNTSH
uniref:Uncharacterized protein n=1 Tax=Hyaloperonospora arabidopsidis (strain Emoy2) TaxID=559515 RepID=M4BKW4_HYAAE